MLCKFQMLTNQAEERSAELHRGNAEGAQACWTGGGVCVGVSVCSCMRTWERPLKKQNCLLGNISQGILIKLQSPTTSRSGPIIHIFWKNTEIQDALSEEPEITMQSGNGKLNQFGFPLPHTPSRWKLRSTRRNVISWSMILTKKWWSLYCAQQRNTNGWHSLKAYSMPGAPFSSLHLSHHRVLPTTHWKE